MSYADSIGVYWGDPLSSYSATGKWNMADASGGAADSSGNGYSLTESGTPTYAQDGVGSDGILLNDSEGLKSSNANLMPGASEEFTAMYFCKFDSNSGAQSLIGWSDAVGGVSDDCLIYYNNGTINIQTAQTLRATSLAVLESNGVNHIAFVRRTAGSLTWYEVWLDAVMIMSCHTDASRDISAISDVEFGFGAGPTPNPSHGVYNRARLYVGAALSPLAIKQHYQQGLSGDAA